MFLLLQPGQPAALAAYAARSLVQIQHVAISCSLLACGAVDVAHGCSLPPAPLRQAGQSGNEDDDDDDDEDDDGDDYRYDDDDGKDGLLEGGHDVEDDSSGGLLTGGPGGLDSSGSGGGSWARAGRRGGGVGSSCLRSSSSSSYSVFVRRSGAVWRWARSRGLWLAGWVRRKEAHSAWAVNLTLVGVVFMTHPQMRYVGRSVGR